MRQRFVQVLGSDGHDEQEDEGRRDALGRFWPRAAKVAPRPSEGIVVDFTAWAAHRKSSSRER